MSQISSNISVGIGSASDSSYDDITSIYSSLSNGERVELSSYFLPLSVSSRVSEDKFCVSDNKFSFSNCDNLIILPVFPLNIYHKVCMTQPVA